MAATEAKPGRDLESGQPPAPGPGMPGPSVPGGSRPSAPWPPSRWSQRTRNWLFFGGVPLLLLGMYGSWRNVADHVLHDPQFCGQCHVVQEQYALWPTDGHQKVACQACHRMTLQQSADMLRAFVAGGSGRHPSGKPMALHTARVPWTTCLTCHGRGGTDRPRGASTLGIDGSVGHDVHLRDPKVTCKSCHSQAIHRHADPVQACGDCHEEAVKVGGMTRLHCTACHDFRSKTASLLPGEGICLDCHAQKGVAITDWSKDQHMASLGCAACHRPHDDRPQGVVACKSCHEQIVRKGLHAPAGHGRCADCHRAHAWKASSADCRTCHQDRPHDKGSGHEGTACLNCHASQEARP